MRLVRGMGGGGRTTWRVSESFHASQSQPWELPQTTPHFPRHTVLTLYAHTAPQRRMCVFLFFFPLIPADSSPLYRYRRPPSRWQAATGGCPHFFFTTPRPFRSLSAGHCSRSMVRVFFVFLFFSFVFLFLFHLLTVPSLPHDPCPSSPVAAVVSPSPHVVSHSPVISRSPPLASRAAPRHALRVPLVASLPCHASPSRHASPLSRRPLATCLPFATRCAFVTRPLVASRLCHASPLSRCPLATRRPLASSCCAGSVGEIVSEWEGEYERRQ